MHIRSVTHSSLRLISWNANGIKPNIHMLAHFLHNNKIQIACIQETHLCPSMKIYIPGYILYRYDRPRNRCSGGVAIFVKNSVTHHQLPLNINNTFENVSIAIQQKYQSTLIITSIYKPLIFHTDQVTLTPYFPPANPH